MYVSDCREGKDENNHIPIFGHARVLFDWLMANKLTLNIKKTNFVILDRVREN